MFGEMVGKKIEHGSASSGPFSMAHVSESIVPETQPATTSVIAGDLGN
jgi:hypothetical protein